MVPITRRDEASDPTASAGNVPQREARFDDGNRQPQMSQSNPRLGEQGVEPEHWMVPDTRDDIVVSRASDY
jgi:hypothetical protein